MYGARGYLAHLGYGAMPLFQDEIIRGHGDICSRKKESPIPYCYKYWLVPKKFSIFQKLSLGDIKKILIKGKLCIEVPFR